MYSKIQLLFPIIIILTIGCKKVNSECNTNIYDNTPKKEWFQAYGGSENESHGHWILSCSDGGFLQVGESGFIPSSSKILVVKVNSDGALLWKKEFSTGTHNLGNSAIEAEDGYLICGAEDENSTIIKLNKGDGSLIFEKTMDNGGNDAFEHLTLTSSGIAAIGYKNAEDKNNTFFTNAEGYLTFLDREGNKQNGISINRYLSQGYRIENFNNELIISGLTQNAKDYGLLKLDSIGNVLWNKEFGGSNADHCFGMNLNESGFIFLTGHTLSGTENWDTYTMKIDNNGNQIWESKQGNPRGFKEKYIHDEAWGIKSTNDGGCIVVAGTGDEYKRYKRKCGNDGDNSDTWHVYLIKYNSDGATEWEKTFGGGQGINWAGEDIDITEDNGLIVGVDDGSFGFLKLDHF